MDLILFYEKNNNKDYLTTKIYLYFLITSTIKKSNKITKLTLKTRGTEKKLRMKQQR